MVFRTQTEHFLLAELILFSFISSFPGKFSESCREDGYISLRDCHMVKNSIRFPQNSKRLTFSKHFYLKNLLTRMVQFFFMNQLMIYGSNTYGLFQKTPFQGKFSKTCFLARRYWFWKQRRPKPLYIMVPQAYKKKIFWKTFPGMLLRTRCDQFQHANWKNKSFHKVCLALFAIDSVDP